MRRIPGVSTSNDAPLTPPPVVRLFDAPSGLPADALALLGPDDLDADEVARARGLRSDAERASFVTRRMRVRAEIAEGTGRPRRDVAFWREPCVRCGGPHGRPRAKGYAGYFSTASTRGLVALAMADAPVGIDVERLVSRETARDVSVLLHPRERDAVAHGFEHGDLVGRRAFTRIWVRKEALLKATGEGLTAPLDRDDLSAPASRPVPGWRVVDLTSVDLTRIAHAGDGLGGMTPAGEGDGEALGAYAVDATR